MGLLAKDAYNQGPSLTWKNTENLNIEKLKNAYFYLINIF